MKTISNILKALFVIIVLVVSFKVFIIPSLSRYERNVPQYEYIIKVYSGGTVIKEITANADLCNYSQGTIFVRDGSNKNEVFATSGTWTCERVEKKR